MNKLLLIPLFLLTSGLYTAEETSQAKKTKKSREEFWRKQVTIEPYSNAEERKRREINMGYGPIYGSISFKDKTTTPVWNSESGIKFSTWYSRLTPEEQETFNKAVKK